MIYPVDSAFQLKAWGNSHLCEIVSTCLDLISLRFFFTGVQSLGSIPSRGKSVGSFPEQRVVIELMKSLESLVELKASKRNLNWSFTPLYWQLMDLSSDQSVERFLHSWPWVKHQHTICRPSGYQDLKRPLTRKPRYKRINLLCVHKDSSKKDKSKWLFYKTELTCI